MVILSYMYTHTRTVYCFRVCMWSWVFTDINQSYDYSHLGNAWSLTSPSKEVTWIRTSDHQSLFASVGKDGKLLLPLDQLTGTSFIQQTILLTMFLPGLGVSFQTSPASVTQNLGSALTLQCSIASVPMATITWQLSGDDISMTTDITTSETGRVTTSKIEVKELEHQHGGSYRCLATNRLLIGLTRFSQLGEVTLIGEFVGSRIYAKHAAGAGFMKLFINNKC